MIHYKDPSTLTGRMKTVEVPCPWVNKLDQQLLRGLIVSGSFLKALADGLRMRLATMMMVMSTSWFGVAVEEECSE